MWSLNFFEITFYFGTFDLLKNCEDVMGSSRISISYNHSTVPKPVGTVQWIPQFNCISPVIPLTPFPFSESNPGYCIAFSVPASFNLWLLLNVSLLFVTLASFRSTDHMFCSLLVWICLMFVLWLAWRWWIWGKKFTKVTFV
jgi:hypothetical protein